jgi:protocatechuate 3,4-dioxygenase beta subunit
MILENEATLTEAVLAAMSRTPDARLREIAAAFVRHSHAFVRDVRPTDAEFEAGLQLLNRIGQTTNDTHNEAVLTADVFGISSLICLLNNTLDSGATPSALLGPFWRGAPPHCRLGDNIARSDTPGPPLFVSGVVRAVEGEPLAGAEVDVWHASPIGLYENQDPEQEDMNLRGVFTTDAEGHFHFRSVRPAPYPVPTHGPVGDVLRAQGRYPYRPAHVHFMITKPGYKTLVTQVFADDSEYLTTDVTFSVIRAIVGHYKLHEQETPPAPDVDGPFYTLDFEFALEAGPTRIPTPPIS